MVIFRVRMTIEEREELRIAAAENDMASATLLREAANSFVADYRERGIFLRSCG